MYEHVNMYVKHGMCAECGLASYMRLAGSLTRLTQEDCLEAHEATYSILWQEQAGVVLGQRVQSGFRLQVFAFSWTVYPLQPCGSRTPTCEQYS